MKIIIFVFLLSLSSCCCIDFSTSFPNQKTIRIYRIEESMDDMSIWFYDGEDLCHCNKRYEVMEKSNQSFIGDTVTIIRENNHWKFKTY